MREKEVATKCFKEDVGRACVSFQYVCGNLGAKFREKNDTKRLKRREKKVTNVRSIATE